MKEKQVNNGETYNLAICDGKKVTMTLQFDIDRDGDPDYIHTNYEKKLGADLQGDLIIKLGKFFDVFGFPRVLLIRSTLPSIDIGRWIHELKPIKKIELVQIQKRTVQPVVTWYFSIQAVHKTLIFTLNEDKSNKVKSFYKKSIELFVPSVAEEVKNFLRAAFNEFGYPREIINESPDKFSFEPASGFDDRTHGMVPSWFDDIVINVTPIDDKEHLLIMEKEK